MLAPNMHWRMTEASMSFRSYIIGVLVFLSGLVYSAVLLGVPQHWIVIGAVVVLALAVLGGISPKRGNDP